MSAKQGWDQHQLLHEYYPGECCLCNHEKEIERLRVTLVENTEIMFEASRKIATIRKGWKKAKSLLLSCYSSSSDTDGAIKIMEKALATTSSLSKLDNPNPSAP